MSLKSFFKIKISLLAVLFSNNLQGQMVSLPKETKFSFGDNAAWALPSFNDNDWGLMQLGKSYTKDSSYAWYRIKITIPSSLKTNTGKGLKLHLGKIDDVDQTFFNGKLIGETGSFPPDYITKWQTARTYILPEREVLWDKENVIAIRIYNLIGGMGMWEGPYKVVPVQWSDFISVQDTIIPTANNGFSLKLKFINNNSTDPFEGTINYRIAAKPGKSLFTETKPIKISSLKGEVQEVVFSNYTPEYDKIVKVEYLIKENTGNATVAKEQLYLAEKSLKIAVVAEPKPVVVNKIKDVFTSISLNDQQQHGYLGNRMNQNLVKRLLKLDEPGTLDGYLERPGHHPWAGEHIGKYLETASNVWKHTGDERLKVQMDRLMYQLIYSQLPDGYLGTYTSDEYWTSWDVWSHKYNLYGLLAYYKATGYTPALDACIKMGDLLCKTFGNKPTQLDIIKAGTHIGMAATSVLDPMVELYKYTGDKKYLDFCYYILDAWEKDNGPKIISSLLETGKVTKVGNGKAYEMLSNFVGLTNLYRVTGDEKLLKPVLIAWHDIVTYRLYITGTTSSHEYFQENDYLPAGLNANMGEGCVTTTWIQFNQQLLAITGDFKYAEQIEKSIYNHLLAAESPLTGCVSYYTPLMGAKPYTCHITCCQSSVPRGIAMIPYFTFGNIKNIPTLLMYEPATYKVNITTADKKNINLALKVQSEFPENGDVTITISSPQTGYFPISLRVPGWCRFFTATAGGKVYKGVAGKSITIERKWKPGDNINVSFKMPILVLSGGKSYSNHVAFQWGPQVLAIDSLLNAGEIQQLSLQSNNKISVAKSNAALLPIQWLGRQAYTLHSSDERSNDKMKQLLFVPFADASQTGGAMKVWLPCRIK